MKYTPINGWTKDKIIQRIRERNTGERSEAEGNVSHSTACAYFSIDSKGRENHCAVGCFIPDHLKERVKEECNTSDLDHLFDMVPETQEAMPLDREALEEMQLIHDECRVGNVKESLIRWIEEKVA